MLEALREHRKKHGHCTIVRSDRENHALSTYVSYLRALKKRGRLAPEKVGELEAIGLRWDATRAYYEGEWDRMRARLAAYKRAHGHCDVPVRWRHGRRLGSWVVEQRARKAKGLLSEDQQQALEKLGITWRIDDRAWER